MKFSFATLGCPDWTLEQIVTNGKAMGYDGVELRAVSGQHIGFDASPQERARVRDLFEGSGLQIPAIMGYSTYVNADAETQKTNVEAAITLVGLARDIGCPVQRVFIGQPAEGVSVGAAAALAAENLKQVVAAAEKAGIKIAIETHDAWTRGESIRAIADAVDSPFLGICWDVCNTHFTEPAETTFQAIDGHIVHVHFKDGRDEGGDIKSKLMGEGDVRLHAAAKLLEDSGYKGYYSFEWEKRWQPDLEEPEVAFPGYIAYCRKLQAEL